MKERGGGGGGRVGKVRVVIVVVVVVEGESGIEREEKVSSHCGGGCGGK